jgi:hypothetical protein
MKLKNISLKDLAIYLSSHLSKNGIDTVLSGGACVSIYTDNKYISSDLDFVLFSSTDQKKLRSVLEKIGFYEENKQFKHKDTEFFVEFLPPPPSVGEEPVKEISKIEKGDATLKLLSPTDCVKDRLASFYHWNDRQSLEQAILVCMDNPVDLKEVERWSRKEGMSNKLKIFKRQLT